MRLHGKPARSDTDTNTDSHDGTDPSADTDSDACANQ